MPFGSVNATAAEARTALPGDEIVPDANVVVDRAFTLPGTPDRVWPWFEQLGKGRSGWYFPRSVERFIPPSRRGIWHLEPSLTLAVGDIIADWGGENATFEVAEISAPTTLVHISTRGDVRLSWAITLAGQAGGTRVHLRLRLGGVKHERLAEVLGGAFDWLTIAGLAAGLRQRLRSP